MRIISTDEENKLWNEIKPYLVFNGLEVILDEHAPENIKKSYEIYHKIHDKNCEEAIKRL